jgi:hypothetical protein
MTALIPELVHMASDPAVSVSDLVRKALVAARRLDLADVAAWLSSELNGYTGDVPDYREIRGHLQVMNPFHGPQPLRIGPGFDDRLSLLKEPSSIPELEQLARSNGALHHHFPSKVEAALMAAMTPPMRPHLCFTPVQFLGIVERVRSRVLEWALDLESRGVLGEGMTFTPQEKHAVQEIHNHNHTHFGDVSGSQIQVGSPGSSQSQTHPPSTDPAATKALADALAHLLDQGKVQGAIADELRAEIATLSAQAASPRPKGSVIRATAQSIKTILEEASGNVLGELAKPHAVTLLALAGSALGG